MAQFLILLAAFLIRILAAAFSGGFSSDTACFAAWADRIYALGPSGFYSPDVFTDYPPGYMYLLYPIGFLVSKTGIPYLGSLHLILLRLPSILCDCITGQLLYKEAKKKFSSSHALFFSALYLFNPAVILNSSLWGQVDSVFTLFPAGNNHTSRNRGKRFITLIYDSVTVCGGIILRKLYRLCYFITSARNMNYYISAHIFFILSNFFPCTIDACKRSRGRAVSVCIISACAYIKFFINAVIRKCIKANA